VFLEFQYGEKISSTPLTADLLISKILHLFYLTHPKGTLQCLKHSTAQHSTALG